MVIVMPPELRTIRTVSGSTRTSTYRSCRTCTTRPGERV